MKWSKEPYSSFKGMVHGIAEAGHEQLLWYLDGVDAVKVDVHITSFVSEAIGRTPQRPDFVTSIRAAAKEIGITPTQLDARIWDWKQKGN